jgi:hypothetical protein
MLRFGQWWRRSLRAGHAFAEGAHLHGAGPERHWRAETRRALLWGAGLPVVLVLAAVIWPSGLWLALAYPAQVVRLSRRGGWEWAFFTVLGKFPEALGALGFHLGRWRGRKRGLIEYR